MGRGFYDSAWKSVKHGSANMDVLVVIGTTSAWFYGTLRSFSGYHEAFVKDEEEWRRQMHNHVHNFETAATLIVIVIFGKVIESYSKMRTVD